MVSLRAGLQNFSVCVLLHNFPDLTEQGFQVLDLRERHIMCDSSQ